MPESAKELLDVDATRRAFEEPAKEINTSIDGEKKIGRAYRVWVSVYAVAMMSLENRFSTVTQIYQSCQRDNVQTYSCIDGSKATCYFEIHVRLYGLLPLF